MSRGADCLTLAGVKLFARLGASAEERQAAQECEADIVLWGDFEPAAATDSLDMAVDYEAVVGLAEGIAGKGEYCLVETLAYGIARAILGGFPVRRVTVRLRKRPFSLAGRLQYIQIEVEES